MGTGRICQGSEEIEDRTLADLLASRNGVARGRMGRGGEEKADTEFADGAPGPFQGQVDANSERLENIS